MADAHKNFAYSLIAAAPDPATTGVSLVVTAGQGALFPAVPFNVTIWQAGVQPISTNAEIVRVTAIATDTLTIVRQQEGTSARTIVVGDQIAATITAKSLNDMEGKRTITEDAVVKAGYGLVLVGPVEIVSGAVLEIEDDGILEIL